MSSNWIRTAFKYALLLTPAAILAGLLGIVAVGARVAAILHDPQRYSREPSLVQTLTRDAYWHTRKHWHTIPACAEFDPELLYRPRPGQCIFENAEFRTTMHFDALGARRTAERKAVAGAARPKLLILGDSHAMGWGVEDDETFASVLAADYGFPTVNLGVSSYATPRELRRLARDFVLGPDDVIVIEYCDNDYRENRHFAQTALIGPYEKAELDALVAYQPTTVSALPVAGLILRLLWRDVLDLLPGGHDGGNAEGPNPSAAFLSVLRANPELRSHRLLVVAVNDADNRTHLSASELAAAGVPLIVPRLTAGDFLQIDDHMRPQGHRTVASAIAAELLK